MKMWCQSVPGIRTGITKAMLIKVRSHTRFNIGSRISRQETAPCTRLCKYTNNVGQILWCFNLPPPQKKNKKKGKVTADLAQSNGSILLMGLWLSLVGCLPQNQRSVPMVRRTADILYMPILYMAIIASTWQNLFILVFTSSRQILSFFLQMKRKLLTKKN